MAININIDIFNSGKIRDILQVLRKVGSRRKLGILRWDNVLDIYPFSGTVVVPVKFENKVFRDPFYFVVEKVNDKESIRIKPINGEQWAIGDVYGFFGLHAFDDYTYDMPILVVEGVSDWAACKPYYKYTLASLTAWIGYRQAFFLSHLSKNVFNGWDDDETGADNRNKNKELLGKFGINVGYVIPPKGDWGAAFESEFGKVLLGKVMDNFLDRVNMINKRLLYG